MSTKILNNKIIYVGDLKSVNLEIIAKSYNLLIKKKINIILIGDIIKIQNYFLKIKFKTKLIELFDLNEISKYHKKGVFVFNICSNLINKSNLILNEIQISSNLAKLYSKDLITMPINKSIIKKETKFNGVTEYLSKINNNNKTYMLMRGENFSIIPLTTHVEFKKILDDFNSTSFYQKLKNIISIINNKRFGYNEIIILGINPHAGENGTLGKEENIIKKIIYKMNQEIKSIKILGPLPADSAFKKTNSAQLFISYYHDQALIPFKILNKKSVNHSIGLSFNRLSPTHGTAIDIMFKKKADNISFIQCMLN
jgi:4-hydroxythreonine-4-phosphate dehydrogenase